MLVCNVTVGCRRERVPAVAPVASAAGCCACAAAIVVAAAAERRERGRAWATCFPPPCLFRTYTCSVGAGRPVVSRRVVSEGSSAWD